MINRLRLEGLSRTKIVVRHMYTPGDLEHDLKRFR